MLHVQLGQTLTTVHVPSCSSTGPCGMVDGSLAAATVNINCILMPDASIACWQCMILLLRILTHSCRRVTCEHSGMTMACRMLLLADAPGYLRGTCGVLAGYFLCDALAAADLPTSGMVSGCCIGGWWQAADDNVCMRFAAGPCFSKLIWLLYGCCVMHRHA
jgi:hypothetical protein